MQNARYPARRLAQAKCQGEGEGEVAFFSAKRWDRRNRADLIESATPRHDAQMVGLYRDSNPLRLTILAAMSEDYTTAPQHLQGFRRKILPLSFPQSFISIKKYMFSCCEIITDDEH